MACLPETTKAPAAEGRDDDNDDDEDGTRGARDMLRAWCLDSNHFQFDNLMPCATSACPQPQTLSCKGVGIEPTLEAVKQEGFCSLKEEPCLDDRVASEQEIKKYLMSENLAVFDEDESFPEPTKKMRGMTNVSSSRPGSFKKRYEQRLLSPHSSCTDNTSTYSHKPSKPKRKSRYDVFLRETDTSDIVSTTIGSVVVIEGTTDESTMADAIEKRLGASSTVSYKGDDKYAVSTEKTKNMSAGENNRPTSTKEKSRDAMTAIEPRKKIDTVSRRKSTVENKQKKPVKGSRWQFLRFGLFRHNAMNKSKRRGKEADLSTSSSDSNGAPKDNDIATTAAVAARTTPSSKKASTPSPKKASTPSSKKASTPSAKKASTPSAKKAPTSSAKKAPTPSSKKVHQQGLVIVDTPKNPKKEKANSSGNDRSGGGGSNTNNKDDSKQNGNAFVSTKPQQGLLTRSRSVPRDAVWGGGGIRRRSRSQLPKPTARSATDSSNTDKTFDLQWTRHEAEPSAPGAVQKFVRTRTMFL